MGWISPFQPGEPVAGVCVGAGKGEFPNAWFLLFPTTTVFLTLRRSLQCRSPSPACLTQPIDPQTLIT